MKPDPVCLQACQRLAGQHAVATGFPESTAASSTTTRPGRRDHHHITRHRRHTAAWEVLATHDQPSAAVSGPARGAGVVRRPLRTLCDGTDLPLQRVSGRGDRHLFRCVVGLSMHRVVDRQLVVHVRTVVGRGRAQRQLPQHDDWSLAQVCRRRYVYALQGIYILPLSFIAVVLLGEIAFRSAGNFAYNYPFFRSVVCRLSGCLSVACHNRTLCLRCGHTSDPNGRPNGWSFQRPFDGRSDR